MRVSRPTPTPVDRLATTRSDTDRFVLAVYGRLRTLASRSFLSADDAEDAVHRCIVKLLTNLTLLVARYPVATAAADALWASGPSDHLRAERIQRCQGAQLVDGPHETRVARRQVEALHTPYAEQSLETTSANQRFGTDAFERIEHLEQLTEVLGSLPDLIRQLLWLVHVEGYTVTEAAERAWCSRSHASRLLSGVRSRLEDLAAAA